MDKKTAHLADLRATLIFFDGLATELESGQLRVDAGGEDTTEPYASDMRSRVETLRTIISNFEKG